MRSNVWSLATMPSSSSPRETLLPRIASLRAVVTFLLVMIALGSTGCVRRRLTVRTFPPGAQVFVDDQEVGITPCSTSFVYYGTRKLTIIKDGYRTETLYQEISPPWYQYPGIDFVTENLVTREFRDERIVDVQMVPQEVVPPEQLQSRAQALRDQVRGGGVTSLPPGAAEAASGRPMPMAPPQMGMPGDGLPGGTPQLYLPAGPPVGSGVPYEGSQLPTGSGETYVSPPTGFAPAPTAEPSPYLPQ